MGRPLCARFGVSLTFLVHLCVGAAVVQAFTAPGAVVGCRAQPCIAHNTYNACNAHIYFGMLRKDAASRFRAVPRSCEHLRAVKTGLRGVGAMSHCAGQGRLAGKEISMGTLGSSLAFGLWAGASQGSGDCACLFEPWLRGEIWASGIDGRHHDFVGMIL